PVACAAAGVAVPPPPSPSLLQRQLPPAGRTRHRLSHVSHATTTPALFRAVIMARKSKTCHTGGTEKPRVTRRRRDRPPPAAAPPAAPPAARGPPPPPAHPGQPRHAPPSSIPGGNHGTKIKTVPHGRHEKPARPPQAT